MFPIVESGNLRQDRETRIFVSTVSGSMNFRENLSLAEELRQDEGTYFLTREFFNVQAQCSRIRGYAEVAPEGVAAAADAIYKKQLQITNWLLDMPGSERYFGDKKAFRAAGKHLNVAKTVANTKVTDAASFARSSAFVFAHSVLDASITSVCEAAVLIKPEEWIGYVENQQVTIAEIQSRTPQELTFDRLAGFIRQLSRESIAKRMERLLNILKPGKEYDGIQDYRLDLETIESYDRTRQDIIHKRQFDIQLDRLEDAITYIEKSFFYFLFLILWRHGKTLNERAWNEFITAPAPAAPTHGKV